MPVTPAVPDERAGPNLVIYFAKDSQTRRAARAIAQKTGGELFDINGKKPLPDLLDYDTFFVGASLAEGRIAAPLEDFLGQTDFMDGRVIPFWTSREEPGFVSTGTGPSSVSSTADLNGAFETLVQGSRFLPGEGFLFARRMKAQDIEAAAETWAEAALAELGLRRAAGGDQAEDMVRLFATAYRERLGPAVFQDGDWTLEMDGVRWYYAGGRFLTQEDAAKSGDFRPQFLYRYFPEPHGDTDGVSPWQSTADRIISRRETLASYRPYRSFGNPGAARSPFFDTLWQARNRTEAFAHQQWIGFLGRQVHIHQIIAAPLGRVDARIRELAENDPEIPLWLNRLESITGWNWRNIAGSASRSFHSYGAAVDLLMKTEAGMETYWQWTAAKGIDWRTVTADKKQNPPIAVIRAFEDQGFIWGGRWSRYDTMHFEYHPELLILGTGRTSTLPRASL
ncbi:MAG: M15 family metallopeptidase [Spirochaetaceae bacterium]|nr:M15 family metallopeptidase [Spirochaetaceae bacterium]